MDKPYSNKGNDYGRYEDYLSKDLVQYVDANFSTIKSREGRFIGGLSMGDLLRWRLRSIILNYTAKLGVRKTTDPIYLAKEKDLSNLKI